MFPSVKELQCWACQSFIFHMQENANELKYPEATQALNQQYTNKRAVLHMNIFQSEALNCVLIRSRALNCSYITNTFVLFLNYWIFWFFKFISVLFYWQTDLLIHIVHSWYLNNGSSDEIKVVAGTTSFRHYLLHRNSIVLKLVRCTFSS